jgi:hypothetical protein
VTTPNDEICQLQEQLFNSNLKHENENAKRDWYRTIGDNMGQQICLDRMKQFAEYETCLQDEIAAKIGELVARELSKSQN